MISYSKVMTQYQLKASVYSESPVTSDLRYTYILDVENNQSDCNISREILATRLLDKGYTRDYDLPGIALKHPTKDFSIILQIDHVVISDIVSYENLLNI